MGSGIDDYAKEMFAKELDATIDALLRDADAPTGGDLAEGTCRQHGDLVMRQKRQAKAAAMTLSILRETHGSRRKMFSGTHVAGISTVISGVILGLIEAARHLLSVKP